MPSMQAQELGKTGAEPAAEPTAAGAMELEQEGSLDQLQQQELLQERRMQDKRSKQKRVWTLKRKFGELTTQIEGAICEVRAFGSSAC
jgi:hypothetical protein